MNKNFRLTIAITTMALAVIATILIGLGMARAGYETAPYEVERKEGSFEIRVYPQLTVVETPMTDEDAGGGGGFNRLFRFISGKNEKDQKIAMTTPVFMRESGSSRVMSFVMPGNLKEDQVPRPTDSAVTVRALPKGRFAVMRFSGSRSVENEGKALAALLAWVKQEGLTTSPAPIYGYFDPPWTPSALRRNEVMLMISGEEAKD